MYYKTAKKLAILKWEYYAKHPLSNTLVQDIPQLDVLENHCGLCHYFEKNCEDCPLTYGDIYSDGCCIEFDKWCHAVKKKQYRKAKYWAKKLLDKIKNIKYDPNKVTKEQEGY
jgi:hypothetical protein